METVNERITEDVDEHIEALDLWIRAIGGFQKKELFKLATTSAMMGVLYKFKPTLIRFFNEELFGDYGIKTLKLDDKGELNI